MHNYITQSSDTDRETEIRQFKLWQACSASQKLSLFKRLLKKGAKLALMGIEHQFPHASSLEKRKLYLEKRRIKLDENLLCRGELMIEDPLWLANYLGAF